MLLGSNLFIGTNTKILKEIIVEKLLSIDPKFTNLGHPDLFFLIKDKDKNSLGIQQAREVTNFLKQKPYASKYKVVVIENAHFLTTQAQNALLKTLEEPPAFACILLTTKNEDALLPTVISRCRKTYIASTKQVPNQKNSTFPTIRNILKLEIGDRLELAEKLAKLDKAELITVLEQFILDERENLVANAELMTLKNIELLNDIKIDLEETNINQRLALEYILINLR